MNLLTRSTFLKISLQFLLLPGSHLSVSSVFGPYSQRVFSALSARTLVDIPMLSFGAITELPTALDIC